MSDGHGAFSLHLPGPASEVEIVQAPLRALDCVQRVQEPQERARWIMPFLKKEAWRQCRPVLENMYCIGIMTGFLKSIVRKRKSITGQIPSRKLRIVGTMRYVSEASKDKIISDVDVLAALLKVFQSLFIHDFNGQKDLVSFLSKDVKLKYEELIALPEETSSSRQREPRLHPEEILFETLGFSIEEGPSTLISAGTGVFVSKGVVPKGAVVSMYPGAIYQGYEPIFFQSIGNPFIFRCIDGILIDGNDKGISKCIYRSCSRRDQLGPFKLSDISWLTPFHQNPLAVGQYVNNCSNDREANVCYQEFDVPEAFPIELRQYIPNIKYSHDDAGPLRCVVLIALRDIEEEEELFSNYYTIVH